MSFKRLSLAALLALFALLSAGRIARPSAGAPAEEPPGSPEQALERARLEQELVLAERTAIMLGELIEAENAPLTPSRGGRP